MSTITFEPYNSAFAEPTFLETVKKLYVMFVETAELFINGPTSFALTVTLEPLLVTLKFAAIVGQHLNALATDAAKEFVVSAI